MRKKYAQTNGQPKLLAQAWHDMADPAMVFDDRGYVLAWNRALEGLLDLPAEAIEGSKLTEALGDRASIDTGWLLETLKSQGSVPGIDVTFTTGTGVTTRLEGNASRLRVNGEQRYALVWRDVGERTGRERALETQVRNLDERYSGQTYELAQKIEALAQANKELQELDQMRSDLISIVSHQIRAPLTNMLGAVERVESGCSDATATCAQMFEVMRDQAARLNRLVGEVLSLASVESGDLALNLEPLSVMPVVDQAIEEMTARDGERFQKPYAPILPLVMADRDRIMEVLVNLLDNADKYSPPEAKIQIEIRPTETEVMLSVLDSGPGLPEEDLERVFDKFYRAEAGDSQRAYGYGLGLYICRRLVEAQGGRIWASNRPDGGASFSFALPVATSLIRH
jgi:PAS domain S-box-containing protein